MDSAEHRLAEFWREDGLADQDGVFALAVMRRLARRRFHANLAALAGVAALAALVLGVCAPWLAALVQRLSGPLAERASMFGPALVALVGVVSVLVVAAPPMGPRPRSMTKV